MATNDFLPFAIGTGANVEDQTTWVSDTVVTNGFSAGIAPSAKFNKVWRQSSFVSSAIAQWMSNQLSADVLDNGNQTTFITQFANALSANIGNIAGVTSLTTTQTVSTTLNGWVIQTPTSGITLTLPSASANVNKTFSFFNTSSGTITLAAGNFNSAVGVGVSSIIIPSGATISLTSDATSWNAFSGALAAGAPVKSQTAAGIGQFTSVLFSTNLMYVPAGGTWKYSASNNGIGYTGIVGGGSAIFSGTLNNAFGWCERIA